MGCMWYNKVILSNGLDPIDFKSGLDPKSKPKVQAEIDPSDYKH